MGPQRGRRESHPNNRTVTTSTAKTGTAWLAVWVLAALAMVAYLQRVGYPDARQQLGSTGLAPDRGVGLFPPWYASQQLLLHGRDPYSSEIAQEIQLRVYGRPAEGEPTSLVRDQHRFAYPLHLSLLLAPTVWLSFHTAQWLVLGLLLASTAASVPWWLRGLGVDAGHRGVLIAAVLGSLAIQQGLHLQQIGMLVAALLAGAVAAVAAGRYRLAGVLLALASVKPHLAAGMIGWMMVWAAGDLRRRRALLVGFGITLVILLGGATLLLPDWPVRWLRVITSYPNYTGARPLLLAAFGRGGIVLGLAAGGALMYGWWQARASQVGSPRFRRVVLLTLATQMLLIPTWIGHNQILLLPVALAAAVHARELWAAGVGSRLILLAAAGAVAWERIAATLLALGSATGWLRTPQAAVVALPVYPLFWFPVLAMLLAVAYARLRPDVQAATK